MYEKSLLQKLEYKYGRFAIQNFMTVIVAVIGLVYVLDSMFIARIGTPLSYYFSFDRSAILAGQVWRTPPTVAFMLRISEPIAPLAVTV